MEKSECRVREFCNFTAPDPESENFAEAQEKTKGRELYCSNPDNSTGLPTGNDFNRAVFSMLLRDPEDKLVRIAFSNSVADRYCHLFGMRFCRSCCPIQAGAVCNCNTHTGI